MRYLILVIFFIVNFFTIAQPPNDNCSNATHITLPNPLACPNGIGGTVNVSGTNIGATAPSPYTYLLGCSTGGNQPAPALDVWYRFVATGTRVTINITGGSPALANPAIALWNGTNCNNLSGTGCDNNGTVGGSNSATFEPLSIGQTYYIQIGGYGMYYMAANPAGLPVPQFNPGLRIRIRLKRGGSSPIYNYRFTTALQITSKPPRSAYDIDKGVGFLLGQ